MIKARESRKMPIDLKRQIQSSCNPATTANAEGALVHSTRSKVLIVTCVAVFGFL
jgi:hypothetical protein